MDPKKRARTVGRVEIVREAVSRRKMRLSDVMSESFSKYLMELDGDFIAPTGLRVSELDETPTQDQIRNRAFQIYNDKGAGQQNQKTNWDQATEELEAEEELVAARNAASPTTPENEEGMLGFQAGRAAAGTPPAAPPTTAPPSKPAAPNGVDPGADNDNINGAAGLGGGNAGTVENPSATEGGEGVVRTNDEIPKDKAPEVETPAGKGDVQGSEDIQGTDTPTDDSSKELGGPDEFDEKNKAFTSYIDDLINGTPTAAGGGDNLVEVSRRSTSLIEAVYGSRKIEIVNYKRSR